MDFKFLAESDIIGEIEVFETRDEALKWLFDSVTSFDESDIIIGNIYEVGKKEAILIEREM